MGHCRGQGKADYMDHHGPVLDQITWSLTTIRHRQRGARSPPFSGLSGTKLSRQWHHSPHWIIHHVLDFSAADLTMHNSSIALLPNHFKHRAAGFLLKHVSAPLLFMLRQGQDMDTILALPCPQPSAFREGWLVSLVATWIQCRCGVQLLALIFTYWCSSGVMLPAVKNNDSVRVASKWGLVKIPSAREPAESPNSNCELVRANERYHEPAGTLSCCIRCQVTCVQSNLMEHKRFFRQSWTKKYLTFFHAHHLLRWWCLRPWKGRTF